MRDLSPTPELVALARRVIWHKSPEEALRLPLHFIAHVLTYGTIEDCLVLFRYIKHEDLVDILRNAPAGIFDIRSWSYWHAVIGQFPPPDLPTRKLG